VLKIVCVHMRVRVGEHILSILNILDRGRRREKGEQKHIIHYIVHSLLLM
jgi:hypothetical protein